MGWQTRVGPRNHVLDGVLDTHGRGLLERHVLTHCLLKSIGRIGLREVVGLLTYKGGRCDVGDAGCCYY